ncbi:sigma-70 family RNA polymerase sigma factor [Lysinibacillus sp. Bpr_S20]|uniref:sigma-70 family RNA polymerase sigma factor n=1 Tax=Lysinibacillus sp. Bpr_S20 TaxID=2933964 RepID=UPI002013667E|nr:sigma-70 family RNA polymerase sigma factor [Lysinibacillus sp. Bpr_S20]MCL1700738.1 sigma-70 family RNA polymerase sigma factor [Lysinibacillus sp. Bpr_S20]
MEKLTNEELVLVYQSESNELAFEELYKRNQGLIFEVIKKFKGTKVINSEDVISDCNLAFSRSVQTFNTSKSCKFSTYCYSIMVNEVLKSIKSATRVKRNPSKYKFLSLNEKVNEEGSKLIDILDASDSDVLHKKDYKYLHNAVEYAKSWIHEKYHPYLLPLMFRETTTNEVAPIIGVSPRTVHYTTTMFREHAREYIYHFSSGEIVS